MNETETEIPKGSYAAGRRMKLPAGAEADVEAERRGRLLRMLWQAVGYEMTFDRGEAAQ